MKPPEIVHVENSDQTEEPQLASSKGSFWSLITKVNKQNAAVLKQAFNIETVFAQPRS
jgi:hypothetical protein